MREAILPKLDVLAQCVKQSIRMMRSLHSRLNETPLTEREWTHYWVVEYANDRGILLDAKFLAGALQCAAACETQLWNRFRKITGLPVGCGARAFKEWLSVQGVDTPSVSREATSKLRRRATGNVAEALELWSAIMRNPLRQYQALTGHCSADGRLRGLYTHDGGRHGMLKFPFFQTDSLSACDGNSADELHKHVSACDNGWLEKNIKSVPDILNGLLGTVFVPDEDKRFAMFSFRQLNQSVLHWLAQANFAACAEGEDFPPEAPLVAEYFPTRDYTEADSAICRLYLDVENAVRSCLTARCAIEIGSLSFHAGKKRLTITLPSGRALVYYEPFIRIDPAGFSAVRAMGLNSDDKWDYRILSGKTIVRDIVRAVARDVLLYKMVCAEANGDCISLPFRDGLLIGIDAGQNLCAAAHSLRRLPKWAEGLSANIDGYLCTDYFKRMARGHSRKQGGIRHAQ